MVKIIIIWKSIEYFAKIVVAEEIGQGNEVSLKKWIIKGGKSRT